MFNIETILIKIRDIRHNEAIISTHIETLYDDSSFEEKEDASIFLADLIRKIIDNQLELALYIKEQSNDH